MAQEDYFERAMNYLMKVEGGYSNRKNDWGGATNFGVTQTTFNSWRDSQGKPRENVKNITNDEAIKIYKKMYWEASGADREKDPRDALILFDTAVQYGDYNARKMFEKSGGNFYKMLEQRRKQYKETVKKFPGQKVNLQGWMNRMSELETEADNMIKEKFFHPEYMNQITPFDIDYKGSLSKLYEKFGKEDREHLKNKYLYLLNKEGQLTGQASNLNHSNHIYTREEIGQMTTDEYAKYEPAILKQMKEKGIPSKRELENSYNKSPNKESNNSDSDGHWVTINGNHVLIQD